MCLIMFWTRSPFLHLIWFYLIWQDGVVFIVINEHDAIMSSDRNGWKSMEQIYVDFTYGFPWIKCVHIDLIHFVCVCMCDGPLPAEGNNFWPPTLPLSGPTRSNKCTCKVRHPPHGSTSALYKHDIRTLGMTNSWTWWLLTPKASHQKNKGKYVK